MFRIEYNFISFGTESQTNSNGYMAVSEIVDKKRYILPINHLEEKSDLVSGYLVSNYKTSIEKLCFARFMLISNLFFEKYKIDRKKNIVVVGLGCVGFGIILNLFCKKYKNITIYSRDKEKIRLMKKNFPNKFNYIDNFENFSEFDYVFDATGAMEILNKIILNIKPFSTFVLFGTPREKESFDVLNCHRKNIRLFGAHELNGYSDDFRRKIFFKTTKSVNKIKFNVNDFVQFINFNENYKRNKIYGIIKR